MSAPAGVKRKSMLPYLFDEVQYYTHQADGIRKMMRMKSVILADDMGLGKAQPISEPVLTPSGWATMGSLEIGSEVVGLDGTAVHVIAVHEQGERPIMRVTFSDGTWTRCDVNHLWAVTTPVRKYRGSPGLILSTLDLLTRGLQHANGNNKFYIPAIAPVEFTPTKPLLDAYTIGVLLGDGALSQHSASVCTDREIVESLIIPYDSRYVITEEHGDYCVMARLNGLAKHLRKYNMMGKRSEQKVIPDDYKWGSVYNRIAVLQGLLDTDGTVVASRSNKGTTIEYGTTSKQLSEDVDHIVRSLGGITSVQIKIPTFTHKDEKKTGQLFYRMVLSLPGWIVPFRLQRKLDTWIPRSKYEPTRAIISIDPDGVEQARCITIDSPQHIYLTRSFTPTHNSLQAITVLIGDMVRWNPDACGNIIVICPTSLKGNWADEFEKFTTITTVILAGTPVEREKILKDFIALDKPKVLIVNYEQVKPHLAALNSMNFYAGIFDEAHYIKNPKSQRTKASQALLTKRSFMLTGSPLLNQAQDLWVLLNRVAPQQFPTYWGFVNRFCVFGGFKDKQIIGVKNEKQLKEMLHGYMIRRLKSEVLDLPEVQIIDRSVDLLPSQRKLYDELKDNLILPVAGADDLVIDNAMVKFLRLKQICATTLPFTGIDESAKLDLAIEDDIELLENGEKVVVFTQFRDVIRAYNSRMSAHPSGGYKVYQLHGDVKPADRSEIVKEWSASTHPSILLCMLQVAGIGLNMTAARHGSFIDELFVPALNQQAIDRLNRIGASTVHPVQIRKYICRNTIESRVRQLLRRKKKLADDLIETDPNFSRKLLAALVEDEDV